MHSMCVGGSLSISININKIHQLEYAQRSLSRVIVDTVKLSALSLMVSVKYLSYVVVMSKGKCAST